MLAFEWVNRQNSKQQLTWTVIPQGFRDAPHLFGQALSEDLKDLSLEGGGRILQYVDDLLMAEHGYRSIQEKGTARLPGG